MPTELAPELIGKKWIQPDLQAAQRWDLLGGSIAAWTAPPGDAAILTAYVEPGEGGQSPWMLWSKDHPELAAELWPLVADAAHLNAYIVLPDLFDAARQHSDKPAPEFRLRMQAATAEGLRLFGEDLAQQGRADLAEQVLSRADALRDEVGGRY